MKGLLFCAFFSLLSLHIYSQDISLKGVILDNNGDPLVSATAVAISAKDSVFLQFGLTNINGKFELKRIKPQPILLQITYLGFDQYSKEVIPTKGQTEIDLGNLSLVLSENKLDEVIIMGEITPIMAKKDTLVYNANAFETTPNEVVEDLLRKMPGIEIEDDGTVIAQGEEVEKVTVDGKDFFGDDPKIATKNLPAKAVDKVEFFDRKSDMSEFTGVDDGERTKTMNLELKEDHKQGQFGTLAAAYGSDERYESRMSINRFSSKLQASVIGNFNNVNKQGFSANEYRSFMTSMGGFMGRGSRGSDISISSGLSDGFVKTNAAGLNLNYDFTPKTKINISYFLNDIGNEIDRLSTAENFFNETRSFITNESGLQLSDNTNHRVQLRFDHEIDSTQDLRLTSNIGLNNANLTSSNITSLINSGVTENSGDALYNTEGHDNSIAGSVMYRKKLGIKKDKSMTINFNLNTADEEIIGDLASENIFFPEDEFRTFTENLLQNQFQTDDVMSYQLRTSYVQPISAGKYFELNYRRQNYDNELIRDVFDTENGVEKINDLLSNHYDRNFVYDRGGIAYHIKTELNSISIEGQVQNSRLTGDIISEGSIIKNSSTSFLPRFSWRRELGMAHSINLRYTTNVREPSITQLQPILDNADPLNLYQGNPDLSNEYRHNVRLMYHNFDQFSFSSIFGMVTTTYSRNKITNATFIDENFIRTTKPINVDYDFNINGRISYSTPIRSMGMKIRLNTNLGYQNSFVFIDDVENKANRYTTRFGVTLDNRSKKVIDASIGANWSYNLTSYNVNSNRDQNFLTQTYNTDITYKPNDNWIIDTDFKVRLFSEQDFGESQTIPIWNASLSRFIDKSKKIELKVSAVDILDKNLGINRSNTLNFVLNEQIISLGRYFLFGITYSIRGTSAKNSGGMMRMGRHG